MFLTVLGSCMCNMMNGVSCVLSATIVERRTVNEIKILELQAELTSKE